MNEGTKTPESTSRKSILELNNDEVRDHFLKHESYCSLDFPSYIVFDNLIDEVSQVLGNNNLVSFVHKKPSPRDIEDVNYTILHNKDGKYSWRPFELINPALYVSLVNEITREWDYILKCFEGFASNDNVNCISLPVQSATNQTDKAEQISHWWHEAEQRSIELSLEYEYLIQTDITDCYGAIYTHSIAWALHTKSVAKNNRRSSKLIGNIIDAHIQDMRYGQTNGIPQGSVLMDFVAEMVLGYADQELSKRLEDIHDYHILRYRDDYRIFVNSPQVGEAILKLITETTTELGLKLNSAKTTASNDVVSASIKSDKLAWIVRKQADKNLQKYLLNIYDLALAFPNSGSVITALNEFKKRIFRGNKPIKNPKPLIAIVVNLAFRNPKTYAVCAVILSKLLSSIESDEEKLIIIKRIRKKFAQIPNTGHMQIWLQRITDKMDSFNEYDEAICKLVAGESLSLWNIDWISSQHLKDAIINTKIVDEEIRDGMSLVAEPQEVGLWNNWFYG